MRPKPRLTCCAEMIQAQEPGTDNEGYGRAVWHIGPGDTAFRIGSRMGDIAFCPWCGVPVHAPDAEAFR